MYASLNLDQNTSQIGNHYIKQGEGITSIESTIKNNYIMQLDGNMSISQMSEIESIPSFSSKFEYSNLSEEEISQYSEYDDINQMSEYSHQSLQVDKIPVIIGFRPESDCVNAPRGKKYLRKIQSNVKERKASFLPSVSVINARSLWPKMESFKRHFKSYNSQVAIITEIWGKNSKSEENKLEELLEMEGIDVCYDMRSDKRGGGTAIAICSENLT